MENEEKNEKVCIETAQLDPNFKFEIAANPDGEQIFYCYQCGTCSATCPVQDAFDILPHQIIQKSLLGFREEVLNSKAIWICSTCFGCTERCPQRVNLSSVLFAIKNIATREKDMPDAFKTLIKNIFEMGRIDEVGDFENEDREDLGLPELEEPDIQGIRRLFKKTKMADLIEEEDAD
jgi:heterodisulfide reductase subunit C